jgi:hypothetical protein
MLKMPSFMGY